MMYTSSLSEVQAGFFISWRKYYSFHTLLSEVSEDESVRPKIKKKAKKKIVFIK